MPQRPFEIFINSKNMEHYAKRRSHRMISAVFRRTSDVDCRRRTEGGIRPRGGAWMQGNMFLLLLRSVTSSGILLALARRLVEAARRWLSTVNTTTPQCLQCGSASLVRVEGCNNCPSCDIPNALIILTAALPRLLLCRRSPNVAARRLSPALGKCRPRWN
jgi:ribonucleoside-diphosphate reductase alpha chain